MSGQEGDLSPKQQAALDQLKKNIGDINCPKFTDYFLLRWLRARAFDVKKAEKMLRDSEDWRSKNDIDHIMEWTPPEVVTKYYPGGYCGFCKEGDPVLIDCLGFVDLKGMFYSSTKKEIVRYRAWCTEYAFQVIFPQRSKELGKRIDHVNMIFDMDGIGISYLWKPAIDAFIEILKMLEANYPETLKVAYVVNAPRIFPVLFNLVKPFLSEDTKTKIRILGGSWKEHLQKDMDVDTLPVHWGGNATDPDGDPFCKSKVCMGGKIPESYHLANIAENIDTSNFTTMSVAKGSSLQLDYEVAKPGSMIRWNFKTEGMDVGFGVFRRTADERQKAGEMEEVVASERVNSHMVPEDGSITCTKSGTYVIRFDNTYSWMNSKKISYLIEVLDPEMDKSINRVESVTKF